jgi:hypothetical protein
MHRERRGASRVSGLLEKTASAHGAGIGRWRRASTIRALCIAGDSRDLTGDSEM